MRTRIDEIKQMPRSQEFAELLVEMEPVALNDLLLAFDDRIDSSMPYDVIDKHALQGNDLYTAFVHCFDGKLVHDFYDWPAPRGDGRGYVRYMTEFGLDAFDLERKEIPPIEDHDEFQYPRHRCDHENETNNDPRCDGRLCLDCGRVMVGSFQQGWVDGTLDR